MKLEEAGWRTLQGELESRKYFDVELQIFIRLRNDHQLREWCAYEVETMISSDIVFNVCFATQYIYCQRMLRCRLSQYSVLQSGHMGPGTNDVAMNIALIAVGNAPTKRHQIQR